MTTYTNPWHKLGRDYGPAEYSTNAKPESYRGHLIYQRITGHVWDVVKDGVCVTQLAGPRGAREAIDRILGEQERAA